MKKLLSLILAALMLTAAAASVFSASFPFTDVKESRWSYNAVKYAYTSKYMDGVGGGKFDPAGAMTRGMVVTVLYRMEGSPEVEFRPDFSDVKDGKYYSDAVIWAKDNNIVNGVSEGVFDPSGKITREQLAAMMYRFSAYKNYNPMLVGDIEKFPDGDKTHSYAKDPLNWATGMGLVTGVKSGDGDLLDPRGSATREQFATILMRFDSTYPVKYNDPVVQSHYTEKEYPLVTDADIYVSPDGNDSDPGDFDHPIATFARAVEMVRSLKATVTDRSIVVAFKAGEYHEDNITMTAEDSGTKEHPVIYCGYGDGEAVITGGAIIRAEQFEPVDENKRGWFDPEAVDKIKKVNVGEILPSFNAKDVIFGDDGVLWVARFPDKYDDGTDHLLLYAGSTVSENEIRISNPAMKRRVQNTYHTIEGLQLYGYLTTGWYKDTLDTAGYTEDPETHDFDFWIPHPETARLGDLRYKDTGIYPEFPWWIYHESCFFNMSEDLNAKGEYWVDPDTLTLYVYDPHGTYTLPVKERAITMNGCDYVTFRGLSVTAYRDKILTASGVVGLTLDRCKFSVSTSTMPMQIWCRGGVTFDTKVTECTFNNFAGRVMEVSGGCGWGDMFSGRGNFLFDNNRVSNTNLVMEWNAAISVGGCDCAVLSHNEFEDCSYMAITYGGCNTVIEYNTFKHCVYNSQDCGVIYCGNAQGDWGNKIRYNLFYPILSEAHAVYLDDDEPAAEIYNNLFIDAGVCIHQGRSNNIHDNIFVHGGVSDVCGGVKEPINQYLETGDENILLNNDFYQRWKTFLNALDYDPDLKAKFFTAYPELSTLTLDVTRAGEPEFVLFPRNYIRNNRQFKDEIIDLNIDEEDTVGYIVREGNVCYKFTENPCFVNPSAGDYRIVDGSGFPDIRFEKIGRY
ncbi:MAG: S-layer homology domain-containing protein [Clostridia bacterium]|nr:S-layer homology domain-containing protein [Clostridia bacterium]